MSGSANLHARKSPSDSHRWLHCTAAIPYERMFALATSPTRTLKEVAEMHELLKHFKTDYDDARTSGYQKDDESEYASEGTRAHDWAEKILLGQAKITDVPEEKDMRSAVQSYVEECQRLQDEAECESSVEAQVPLFYALNETGTMDFAVPTKDKVRVRDYKHGVGIYVEAKENPQLAIYAFSYMQWLEEEQFFAFEPDTVVEIGIWQPRHRQWDPAHLWILTYHDLKAFCRRISAVAERIDRLENLEFHVSVDTCRWCKLKAFCGTRLHHLAQGLPILNGETVADLLADMPNFEEHGSQGKFEKAHPDTMERINTYVEGHGIVSEADMVRIYRSKKGIEAFLSDVGKYLTARALSGHPVEGTKLVMGNPGDRAWSNNDNAEVLLLEGGLDEDAIFTKKIISPAQAEKLLANKFKEKLNRKPNPGFDKVLLDTFTKSISRSSGKPTLAMAEDSREAIGASALDGFEIEDDEEYDLD